MAYSREIEKLERQFNENPRRFAAPFADALRKSDEVARALEVIKVGLELNPEYIPGSVILGRCHLDLGDDHAAEAAFSRVLDLDNENVIALKSLADIMERQGRTDEAVRFLTYLLDVDRSNAEAREQLARIQAGTGAAAQAPAVPVAEPPVVSAEPVFGAPPGEPEPAEASAPAEFVEPTALWEPSEAPAASLSSWVEPTSVDLPSVVEPVESLIEEPASPGDFPPVEGLEGVGGAAPAGEESYREFMLEREEEIVLNAGAGAEYQVANDSESLLGSGFGAAEAPPEPTPAPEREPEPEPEATPVAESYAGFRSVIAEELGAQPAPAAPEEPTGQEGREAPIEWAMHVAEEREFVPTPPAQHAPHSPDSFDDAIEGIAPDAPGAGEPEAEAEAEALSAPDAEAPLVVTESMAELYAAQGHPSEALGVYRILFDRNPGNDRLRHRIQELEAVLAAQVAADTAPSYAASVTGGTALAGYFGSLLQARPVPVNIPEPPPAAEPVPVASTAGAEGEEALASGAPTRPAIDRLSLGAVFGEDPSPIPPAEAAKSEGAAGFSFDDFFGGGDATPAARTSAGASRSQRATEEDDDLDQFHSWLQSLKR